MGGPFCIVQDCDNLCTWENTVYIKAITKYCQNVSCNDEFETTLLPLHIVAVQSSSSWTLTATLADADCNVYTIFQGTYNGDQISSNGTVTPANPPYNGCDLPGAFVNTASGFGSLSKDVCCICFPVVNESCNISCVMSPDMGLTWYDFKGITRTLTGELARRPVVTLDKIKNQFHLFYIIQGNYANGLFHKVIDATLFNENDAFIPYVPPSAFTDGTDDNTGLTAFSPQGQTLRKLPSDLVSGTLGSPETTTSVDRYNQGQSYRFTTTPNSLDIVPVGDIVDSQQAIFQNNSTIANDPVDFQEYSAYIDNTGRIYLYYFEQRGTLPLDQIDVPPQFTGGIYDGMSYAEIRYNATLAAALNCPEPYTFTVTGIDDTDCECAQLNGDHNFIQYGDIDHYISGEPPNNIKWTLTFSDPYWTISSVECPTTGQYTLICNRCIASQSSSSSGGHIGIVGILKPAVNPTPDPSNNSSSSSSSSSSATIRPFDAVVQVLSSADNGRTWTQELPGRGGHFGALAYDALHDFAYMFYVTDDMLFCRRYPALLYHVINDTQGGTQLISETLSAPIDPGLSFDPRDFSADGSIGTIGDIGSQLDLPILSQETDTITTVLPSLPALKAERDKFGVPTFIAGEKTGGFLPFALYPYTDDYVFDSNVTVGAARPAAWVTPGGGVRFFYIDQNGNINGGYLPSIERPIPDMKVQPCQ